MQNYQHVCVWIQIGIYIFKPIINHLIVKFFQILGVILNHSLSTAKKSKSFSSLDQYTFNFNAFRGCLATCVSSCK